jgi:hypothetical protein
MIKALKFISVWFHSPKNYKYAAEYLSLTACLNSFLNGLAAVGVLPPNDYNILRIHLGNGCVLYFLGFILLSL